MEAAPTQTQTSPKPGPAGDENAKLVAAVLRRDRKAAAEFVERFSDPLFGYLRRRLVPRTELAEDLLQDVFLTAFDSLPRLREPSMLRSWLFGIARHKVEDHYRNLLREPESIEDEDPGGFDVGSWEPLFDETIDRERLHAQARDVLASLPERYAKVLLWRYWEKRSAMEMSEMSGRSSKAIERLLARARAQFKRRWDEQSA